MERETIALGLCLALFGCQGGPVHAPTPPPPASTGGPSTAVAAVPSPTPKAPNRDDDPRTSRSAGVEGGVVVFWPRIVVSRNELALDSVAASGGGKTDARVNLTYDGPRTDDPDTQKLAAALQQKLVVLVKRALPGMKLDVRPAPERVCPPDGCLGMTVGVLLAKGEDGGCATLALTARPGKGDTEMTPWGGTVKIVSAMVPFREFPEKQMWVRDHAACDTLVEKMAANDEAVIAAIKKAAGR